MHLNRIVVAVCILYTPPLKPNIKIFTSTICVEPAPCINHSDQRRYIHSSSHFSYVIVKNSLYQSITTDLHNENAIVVAIVKQSGTYGFVHYLLPCLSVCIILLSGNWSSVVSIYKLEIDAKYIMKDGI